MEPWLESFARANFRRSADTAHDLKTPLNVAVLNLELLRMRLRKLAGEDEKLAGYTQAIETELRRMGRIFDAFFLLSTPPGNEGDPGPVDVAALASEVLGVPANGAVRVDGHESRIRHALKLFLEGASSLLAGDDRQVTSGLDGEAFHVTIVGRPAAPEQLELTKVFKFYYTDPQGNPDLSLAVARLIAETYGGELSAAEVDSDKVSLRLSFPLGAK